MAFYEIRFPEILSFEFAGGEEFMTDVAVSGAGFESRNQNWAQARRKWQCSHVPKERDATQQLRSFFNAMAGRVHGFRFKDWTDYEVKTGEGVFTQITPTTFQLVRRYTFGGQTHDRVISKPVAGTVVVTGGVSPSINTATGVVTVTSGTPTSWIGEFDVPARFDTDRLNLQMIERQPITCMWGDVPIVEIRV
jgi:uncharacterized protein (TIGR02217 family)